MNSLFITVLGAALACFDTHAFAPPEAARSSGANDFRASSTANGGETATDDARDGTHAGNPSVMADANGA